MWAVQRLWAAQCSADRGLTWSALRSVVELILWWFVIPETSRCHPTTAPPTHAVFEQTVWPPKDDYNTSLKVKFVNQAAFLSLIKWDFLRMFSHILHQLKSHLACSHVVSARTHCCSRVTRPFPPLCEPVAAVCYCFGLASFSPAGNSVRNLRWHTAPTNQVTPLSRAQLSQCHTQGADFLASFIYLDLEANMHEM